MWLFIQDDSSSRSVVLSKCDCHQVTQTAQCNVSPSLLFNGADKRLEFSVTVRRDGGRGNNATAGVEAIERFSSKKALSSRTWTHIALQCSGKVLRIYINGMKDAEHALMQRGRVVMNSGPFYFGRQPAVVVTAASPGGSGDVASYSSAAASAVSISPYAKLDPIRGVISDCRLYLHALDRRTIAGVYSGTRPKRSRYLQEASHIFRIRPLASVPSLSKVLEEIEASSKMWTLEKDQQLVDVVCHSNLLASDENIFDVDTDRLDILHSAIHKGKTATASTSGGASSVLSAGIRTSLLQGTPLGEFKQRFSILRMFNTQLRDVLPLLDFAQSSRQWSLVRNLCRLKGIIFLETKLSLWNKIVGLTTGGAESSHRPSVNINRPRASRALEKKTDTDGSKSVFGQMFRQLHFISPTFLRKPPGAQVWSVVYAGEGGQDAGGLFRDSMSHVCADLMSEATPLFLPCPNSRGEGFGDNQETVIPNSFCTSSLHISMYQFVGKLMGMALRGKHILNLDFPPMVWKPLVGDDVTREDLAGIDVYTVQAMEKLDQTADDDKAVQRLGLRFVTKASDGEHEVELVPNGGAIAVTTRKELSDWIEKVYAFRLNEFSEQIAAIKKGMSTVVPVQLLPLLTWKELELNVCGKRDIDVALLQQNTKYKGYKTTDKQIRWMWEMLSEFSAKEREMFLRFVWGRSRLPLRSEDFHQKFVVMSCTASPKSLPISHTCFFQLELPKYPTKSVMASKMLYAVTECRAIDTDHAAQNIDWDADD